MRRDGAATALVILAILASMAAIHLLKVILIPVVLALLLACMLSPLTALLRRVLPLGATGAAVVLFLLLTMLGLLAAWWFLDNGIRRWDSGRNGAGFVALSAFTLCCSLLFFALVQIGT